MRWVGHDYGYMLVEERNVVCRGRDGGRREEGRWIDDCVVGRWRNKDISSRPVIPKVQRISHAGTVQIKQTQNSQLNGWVSDPAQ